MSDYLILYICQTCAEEHYFDPDNLPGGDEFCEFCDHCGGVLEEDVKKITG